MAEDSSHSEEIWKDIPGYEGSYQASSLGRIRSLDREVYRNINGEKCLTIYKGRLLKFGINKNGYHVTYLERSKAITVHNIIGNTFLGYQILKIFKHKNGNKLDNRITNLECTKKEKQIRNNNNSGESNKKSKLTKTEALEILKSKEKSKILSSKYKVHMQTINSIRNRTTWKHIEP